MFFHRFADVAGSRTWEETMASREKTPGQGEISVEQVSEAIKGAMPILDETDRQIAAAVYRHLSLGGPAEPTALAEEIGIEDDYVESRLASSPGVGGKWIAEHPGTTLLSVR
jgi:hypothetical protein